MQRFFEIDLARGLAVVAMIAFHALFNLNYFAGYSFVLEAGLFLALGRFSAAAFLFLVGLSLTISFNRARQHKRGVVLFKKYLFRGLKIFSLGLAITAFTWIFFPGNVIVFGVLHCIGLSIILAFPLLRKRHANLLIGAAFILTGLFLSQFSLSYPWLLWLGLMPAGFASLDYFPLLPWFGVVLIGVFAGNWLYGGGERAFQIRDFSGNGFVRLLSFLGRNSLLIYFLHQPVLVAIILLLA